MRTCYSLFVIVVLLSFNTYAGGKHEGGHPDDDHHWQSPADMSGRVNPVSSSSESVTRGKELFGKFCASCHGQEARGDGPVAGAMKVKPTDLVAMAGKHPDGDFAWKIAKGRGPMPGWEKTLTDNQIWDLVNFIQSLEDSSGALKQNGDH